MGIRAGFDSPTHTNAIWQIYKPNFMRKFPFTEGQDYYTIDEDNNVVWSCWDCISEELHTPDRVYFKTQEEAEEIANFNKKYSHIISLLQTAQNKLTLADIFISNQEKPNAMDDVAEAYIFDAINNINRTIVFLQQNNL